MTAVLNLTLPPDLGALALLGERLRPFLEGHYGPLTACYEVELAAVEMLSNVVRHNRPQAPLRLRCACSAGWVSIRLSDDGFAFDMTARRTAAPPHPLQPGGRGLWLIQQLASDLRYRRRRGGNEHTFIRRLGSD